MGRMVPKDMQTDIEMVALDMVYMTKNSRNSLKEMAQLLVQRDQNARGWRVSQIALKTAEQTAEIIVEQQEQEQEPSGDSTDPRLA